MAGTPGKVVPWRQWAFANAGSLLANFGSLWLLLGPLLAAYAPRRLFQTYFNLFLRRHMRRLLNFVDPYVNVHIIEPGTTVRYSRYGPVTETDGTFEEVQAYLSGACWQEARELRADGAKEGDGLLISMRGGQEVADEFEGVTMWWQSVLEENRRRSSWRRCHRLTFHRRHRRMVIDEYLPHVRRRGREILFSYRRRRLYTNNKSRDSFYDSKPWSYIDFDHPTTFDTLGMDLAKKQEIKDDLDAFRNNKEFYRRTGKPWKRGYLLYGPPGTGKSTMIAAMANYLDYDIYDVELTVVSNNHDLRKLLIETTSKSIIVIEDIDCSLDLTGKRGSKKKSSSSSSSTSKSYESDDDKRRDRVTLSGLLNFIDGLWSACGNERIVVFTTNHVDKLDPALIRRGRMDMHIEMSYCRAEAFRTLAKNYLDIDEHELFNDVDRILQEENLTPADVSECLVAAKRAGSGEPSTCLEILIDELKKRAEEKAKAEAEAKAKAEAEAKAEEEAKTKAEAEAKAKIEEEAKAKVEAEAKAKAEVEAKTKAEAEGETNAAKGA
ncbi:hypothetical protein PR202_gb12571 [Eleusine coracana subsp. coracana]|uniref:AAA+ ATPase domain-containing protein n=1 Tax=Eleusine coracana subsp. coracana TaxID=191504 RepID=A0AAV5ERB6_ELECO|nr:hypothetical protein QOZ80_7BG0590630 [Eleusine coracana subsp. coracana]GJN24805.1 hypothetical protein PR202_gb12571 [Eleusine coracana subsp. coracana]